MAIPPWYQCKPKLHHRHLLTETLCCFYSSSSQFCVRLALLRFGLEKCNGAVSVIASNHFQPGSASYLHCTASVASSGSLHTANSVQTRIVCLHHCSTHVRPPKPHIVIQSAPLQPQSVFLNNLPLSSIDMISCCNTTFTETNWIMPTA